jgi:type II secretory pathway pseudopilin PulG
VIVAMVLIGIVATAAISFFVSGVKKTSDLQRKQGAVSLANTAMDRARAVAPGVVSVSNSAGSTHGLVKGRTQQAVFAARDAADPADVADMDFTYAYDRDPNLTSDAGQQWVPITQTATVNSQDYTITTLIGACYRSRLPVTTEADCIKDATLNSSGDPVDSSTVKLYRIRVVVEWSAGSGTTPQSYRIASLADPSADAVWNTIIEPFAYDDEYFVTAGRDTSEWLWVTANDTLDYDESGNLSPIVNLTQPPSGLGSAAVGTGNRIGGVNYTLPPNTALSGAVQFQYAIKDLSANTTDPATVTVQVLPNPQHDELTVPPGSSRDITSTLLGNDYGTQSISSSRNVRIVPVPSQDITFDKTTCAPTDPAPVPDLTVNGAGEVTYQASLEAAAQTVIFYYYLVSSGVDGCFPSEEPAIVTIRIVEDPPQADDYTIDVGVVRNGAGEEENVDLKMHELTGNPDHYLIRIVDTNIGAQGGQGTLIVGRDSNGNLKNYAKGVNEIADEIWFRQQGNSPYIVWFDYQVVTPGGLETEVKRITLHNVPVAHDDSGSVNRREDLTINVRSNDWPFDATAEFASISSPSCGSIIRPSGSEYNWEGDGNIKFRAPNSARTCTFTYTLRGSSAATRVLVSKPATVTIVVR